MSRRRRAREGPNIRTQYVFLFSALLDSILYYTWFHSPNDSHALDCGYVENVVLWCMSECSSGMAELYNREDNEGDESVSSAYESRPCE